MKNRRWKLMALIAGGVVAAILIASIVFVAPFAYALLSNPFDDQSFQRNIWLAARGGGSARNPRGPMAEDLRKRFLHQGMPKQAVRSLLGKSDNSQYDEATGREDRWYLGVWGYMVMDGDYLVIHYDKARRIASTEIYSH